MKRADEMIGILRVVPRRRRMLPAFLAVLIAAVALPACGGSETTPSVSSGPADAVVEPIPTRKSRAKACEPGAGESAQDFLRLA